MNAVLKENGIVLYLSLGHSGFNVNSELGGFLTVVESGSSGLEVLTENSEDWPFQSKINGGLEFLLYQSLSKKEIETIRSSGGCRILVLKKRSKKKLKLKI